jgi:hypothetical protein
MRKRGANSSDAKGIPNAEILRGISVEILFSLMIRVGRNRLTAYRGRTRVAIFSGYFVLVPDIFTKSPVPILPYRPFVDHIKRNWVK